MYNANSGYIGYSRSNRSQQSIDSFEVPLSLINKSTILDFLEENEEEFSEEEFKYLEKLAITKWKYVAKNITPATSWHHTSSYFNETDHYCLYRVSEDILKIKDTLEEEYKKYKSASVLAEKEFRFGTIEVKVWGGTRRNPRVVGYEEVAGIIINHWLYFKENHEIHGKLRKYKIDSNNVVNFKSYDSYNELIKNSKQYKSTKIIFNQILKEKKIK